MVVDDTENNLQIPDKLQQSKNTLEQKEQLKESEKGKLRISPENAWTVLNVTVDSFFLIDTNGIILAINEAGANRLQLDLDNAIGANIFDNIPPEVEKRRMSILQEVCLNKKPIFYEVKRGDQWFDTCHYPVITDGKVTADVVYGRDITERKQAEKTLRETEKGKLRISSENARAIVNATTDAIYLIDTDGIILAINEAGAARMGLDVKNAVGTSLFYGVSPDVKQRRKSRLREVVLTKKPLYFEGELLRDRWYDTCLYPVITDGTVTGAALYGRDITERKQAEKLLFNERHRFKSITDCAPFGMAFIGNDGVFQYINPKFKELFGYNLEDIPDGKTWFRKAFPDPEYRRKVIFAWVDDLKNIGTELKNPRIFDVQCKDRSKKTISFTPVEVSKDEYLVTCEDITERKQAEEEKEHLQTQFLHAQKMEAVGRLAGGMAHDFNNMLSIIIGYGELIKEELSSKDPLYLKVEEMLKAANKSADLTRQLLAFSHQQIIEPMVLDFNSIITDSEKMLRRLLGEDIDLKFIPYADLWPVRMDPSQIDQIFINLVINARDSMTDTGKLIIETGNTTLDEAYCAKHLGALPGNYVVLTVSDTGSGIDKETLQHIFEPFFTTKGEGKGTGLGLSTIFGIVKQNRGFINVYSEPGIGTVFRIYFPRYIGQVVIIEEKEVLPTLRGNETILVVEDEEQILEICRTFLDSHGYRVLTAGQPGEAIILCEKYKHNVHLLITDVIMPTMNGRELKERIEKLKPGIRVLYMSGYTSDVIAHRGVLTEDVTFIQKPFTMEDFLRKVKDILQCK